MKRKLKLVLLFFIMFAGYSACQRPATQPGRVMDPVTLPPLDPDHEVDALTYEQVTQALGAVSKASHDYKIAVVLKFFGNQYWQLLAEGAQAKADALGVSIDVRAAATESDPEGQRQIMQEMLAQTYDAFIISPQTDDNLIAPVEAAQEAGLPVLVVNEIVRDARYWVGPRQYDSGMLAAQYIQVQLPGGKVAVIQGPPSAYAARQRSKGFEETMAGDDRFDIVASLPANWDSQQALNVATDIMAQQPDLDAFYCHNDIMAMGVLAALRADPSSDAIIVVGTDGIAPAYEAIRAGDLSATVDSTPFLTGEIAVEIIVRLLEGQAVPRVIYSPQSLVTQDALKE